MPEITEFLRVIKTLIAGNVRFVLIGGVAMRLHGSAHVTDDVDIGYSREPDNMNNVIRALAGHRVRLRGVPEDLPFIFDGRTMRNGSNFTFRTDIGDIDILGDIAGVESFDGLWNRSVVMEMDGISVHVASLDDLIAMKRAANRLKDQNHILELLALRDLRRSMEEPA